MKLMQNVSVAVARKSARIVGVAPDNANAGADVVGERCRRGRTAAADRLALADLRRAAAPTRRTSRHRPRSPPARSAMRPTRRPAPGPRSRRRRRRPRACRWRRAGASRPTRSVMNTWSARLIEHRRDAGDDGDSVEQRQRDVARERRAAESPAARPRARDRRRSCSGRRRWRSTKPPPNHARIAPGSVSATVSKPRS